MFVLVVLVAIRAQVEAKPYMFGLFGGPYLFTVGVT
jgi:hypothetical protein